MSVLSLSTLISTLIYCCDNKKGGVGKTTTAWNLATLLAAIFGWKILLIDLDSDRCLTDGIGGGGFEAKSLGKQTILDVLINPKAGFGLAKIPYDLTQFAAVIPQIAQLAGVTPKSGGVIDLVAGSEDLAEAPDQFRDFPVTQPVARFEQALPWLVRQPEVTEHYNAVFIDIGPGWDVVTRSGLFASDYAIVPVRPASLDIEALKRHQMRITRANTERARANLNAWQTKTLGVLISQVDPRSEAQSKIAADLRAGLTRSNIPCFTTEIPTSDTILVATKDHTPAWAAYPNDASAQQFVKLACEVARTRTA